MVRPSAFDHTASNLPSTSRTCPSNPARTRAGRHTRDRNNVRRSAPPTAFVKINPCGPSGGYSSIYFRKSSTNQSGNGTARRPARDFGNALNSVCPATSVTVRITLTMRPSRSTASRQSPTASPQRRPVNAAVATRVRYLVGCTTGTSRCRTSSRVTIRSSVSRTRRPGTLTPSVRSMPINRFLTADRITPDISRLHSATVPRDRLSDKELTHVCTER